MDCPARSRGKEKRKMATGTDPSAPFSTLPLRNPTARSAYLIFLLPPPLLPHLSDCLAVPVRSSTSPTPPPARCAPTPGPRRLPLFSTWISSPMSFPIPPSVPSSFPSSAAAASVEDRRLMDPTTATRRRPGKMWCPPPSQMSRLPVKAFRCEPFANSIMGRELCLGDIDVGGDTKLVIATSHLESPCPAPPQWDQMYSKERVAQAKRSLDLLKDSPNVVFGDDMN